jgi:hypothetical protein
MHDAYARTIARMTPASGALPSRRYARGCPTPGRAFDLLNATSCTRSWRSSRDGPEQWPITFDIISGSPTRDIQDKGRASLRGRALRASRQRQDCFDMALAGVWGRLSERHFLLQIGQPASDFTKPRSLERFDIPEGTLNHSVG